MAALIWESELSSVSVYYNSQMGMVLKDGCIHDLKIIPKKKKKKVKRTGITPSLGDSRAEHSKKSHITYFCYADSLGNAVTSSHEASLHL